MKKLLSQIIAAGAGLWLATLFVPGVMVNLNHGSSFFGIPLTEKWQIFILFGIILGLLNYFVKPVIKLITLPLRILTLGLFGIAVSMAMTWVLTIIFSELIIPLYLPLLETTLIVWILNIIIKKVIVQAED